MAHNSGLPVDMDVSMGVIASAMAFSMVKLSSIGYRKRYQF